MKRHHHNFPLITAIACAIFAGIFISGWFYENPMWLKTADQIVNMGENYKPYQYMKFLFLAGNDDVEVIGNLNTGCKGTYNVVLKARAQEVPVKITVIDNLPPEVRTKDVKADMKRVLKPEDFINSIKDAQETSVVFEAGQDLDKKGRSKISLIARDADGNSTKVIAQLHRSDDHTPPVIKGLESEYSVLLGKSLDCSKIHIADDLDPEPKLSINTKEINTNEEGEYILKVSAKDASGNKKEEERVVKVIKNPEYAKNIVYLTFDDGPSANTKDILKILKKENVKATFFVTAQTADYAEYMKQAIEEGHSIGLHSYTHDYEDIYRSEENYFKDLEKVSDFVKDATGYESKLLRFPGGSSNTISAMYNQGIMSRLTKEVEERGYTYFDWNITSSDATGWGIPANDIVKSSCTDQGGNLVILLHDTQGKETTVEALPKIIKYYKDRGYTFKALAFDSFNAHHPVNN